MPTVEIVTKTKLTLDVQVAAKWFCGLSDEQQADFFIAVAKEAESWDQPQWDQWWLVGKHLRTCSCSTDEARELVHHLYRGLAPANA